MKIYYQIAILLAICMVADIISSIMPFPFPTNVTAMVILLLLLFTKLIKLEWVETVGDTLINNMQIMFIPAGVTLMISYEAVLDKLASFLFICIISTLITWLTTYYTIAFVMKLQKKAKAQKAGVVNE